MHCKISKRLFFSAAGRRAFSAVSRITVALSPYSTDLYTHFAKSCVPLQFSQLFCGMPQANAPLTLPSANKFAGIWSNGKEPCPITLMDLVTIHNACVRLRSGEADIPRSGALSSADLHVYKTKVPLFLSHWPHRLSQVIKPANRIECLDEDGDKIPPLFLKRWDKTKTANAQDDFIKDDLVKTFQLAHVTHDESFAKFYEATYKKLPSRPKLSTAEELETLCMICILEYKVLGGCDLQWKDASPTPEARSFLPSAGAGADDDAISAGSGRRGRAASSATPADGSPRGPRNKRSAAATAPAQAAAGGEGGDEDQRDHQRDEDQRPEGGAGLDMDDIVNWGLEDNEFPLNKLEDMKFDVALPPAQQRTMHAAAILLFYRKRTPEQEKVFRDLCGLWGEVRGTHIQHALLCHPPSAGATMYTPNEAEWCRKAQKALIERMDSTLRNELEIPDSTDESRRGRSRHGGRAAAGALDGQDNLRQPPASK